MTLQPYYSDRFLLSNISMAGLVILMHGCLDTEHILQKRHHWMFYYLGLSIYPKWLFLLDEENKEKSL